MFALDVSKVNYQAKESRFDNRSDFLFWPDEVLVESIALIHQLQELVKQHAREDENPWRNLHYHGYLALSSAKLYLRRQMMHKTLASTK